MAITPGEMNMVVNFAKAGNGFWALDLVGHAPSGGALENANAAWGELAKAERDYINAVNGVTNFSRPIGGGPWPPPPWPDLAKQRRPDNPVPPPIFPAQYQQAATNMLAGYRDAILRIVGNHMHQTPGIGAFINNAVSSAGHLVGDVEHLPVVSQALDVAGKVRDVYVGALQLSQGLVSMIPGIGTALSSAMGAIEGVLDGQSPLEVVLRIAYGAIPIPAGVRSLTDMVFNAVMAIATNLDNLTNAALNAARNQVPEGFPRDVFDTLIHVIDKQLNATVNNALSKLGSAVGQQVSSVVKSAEDAVTHSIGPVGQKGFQVGTGLMLQKNLSPSIFGRIRDSLPPDGRKGFDAAVSLATARVHFPAPPTMTPGQKAGFLMTHGASHGPTYIVNMSNSIIGKAPTLATGALVAQTQIAEKATWWQKVKHFFTGHY